MVMVVVFIVGAVLVWIELVVRSSLIYLLVAAAPLMPAWSSTCPSHGITLMTVWQDRSQQRLRTAGREQKRSGTTPRPRSSSPGSPIKATAEVTSLLGEEEHQRMGSSIDLAGARRSVRAQTGTRRLVSEDSLRRQRLGQGLLIYKDLPAMRLSLRPYYQDRKLKALQEAKPGSGTSARRRDQTVESGAVPEDDDEAA
jgi:hypothetical protein